MTISFRHTRTSLLLAIATCAAPALAQNAAPAPPLAATAATSYGTPTAAAPANPGAAHRNNEAKLLGAPRDYGSPDAQQGNTADAQQAALLDEQRMTVLGGQGGQPAVGKAQRNKAPAAANGKVRVAGQPGRPNAADGLMPDGAAKTTYADPYAPGKHAVYKSPW